MRIVRAVATDESEFHGAVTRDTSVVKREREQTKILVVNFVSMASHRERQNQLDCWCGVSCATAIGEKSQGR